MKKESIYMPLVAVIVAILIEYVLSGVVSYKFLYGEINFLIGCYIMRYFLIRHYEGLK